MYSQIDEAKRARLWRPLPPMPTKSMLPRGCPMTRTIRVTGGWEVRDEGSELAEQPEGTSRP